MSYGPYYDPTGRTEFTKKLWKGTNELNAAIEKDWSVRREEKRRLNRDSFPGPVNYGRQRSGSGGSFLLAAALVAVGCVLLHLL
jgi:hypothetical protein